MLRVVVQACRNDAVGERSDDCNNSKPYKKWYKYEIKSDVAKYRRKDDEQQE